MFTAFDKQIVSNERPTMAWKKQASFSECIVLQEWHSYIYFVTEYGKSD